MNVPSSEAIEAKIAINRARRARSRRYSLAAMVAALAVQIGTTAIDAPNEIRGISLLVIASTIIGANVFTNWHDEAYRLYALRLAALAGGFLTITAIGTSVASAITGEQQSATDWQLQALAALLIIANIWIEPEDDETDK